MRRSLRAAVLLGVLLAGGAIAGAPAAAEKVRVTYPNLNGAYIFLFTAIDKGYYAQEGIEIELLESGGGSGGICDDDMGRDMPSDEIERSDSVGRSAPSLGS